MSRSIPPAAPPQKISVIVPFYNEGESISTLLEELREVLDHTSASCEIIAIDDGSTDDTFPILQAFALRWPALKLARHLQNQGQASALWTGFKLASGDVVVTLDGDGQNDPHDIPGLVSKLAADEADMVSGYRQQRKDSLVRKLMSRTANAVRSSLLHDGVHDAGCALKAFRRAVVSSFVPIRTLYSFMPAMAVAAGFQVVEMPVNHRERKAGISKYGLRVMFWRPALDLLGMWWFRSRRLKEACL